MTTSKKAQVEQENTSGATLHVPVLGADVGPGERVTHEVLIPGFTAVADLDEEKPAKSAAKKTSSIPTTQAAEPADPKE